MTHIYQKVTETLQEILKDLTMKGALPEHILEHTFTVEPTRDIQHGEIATNIAMVIAKPCGKSPRDIALLLKEALALSPLFISVEIAGPGFINLVIEPCIWQETLLTILNQGLHYGDSAIGKGHAINLEYVSANPTGPMHIGHARGAVYGDALAGLLQKAGYHITKEYYINDAGHQMEIVAHSAYLRYREAAGETITIPEGLYPGEYLIPVGKALFAQYGKSLLEVPKEAWLPKVRHFTTDAMMRLIREDLLQIGICHDVFFSELTLHEQHKIEETVALLAQKDLVYRGVLEPPKGKLPDDWEPREQLLFRSTLFGDDCDRPLQKSDGSWTYFAADIAYLHNKMSRGFRHLIFVLGADHAGYPKRLQAAAKALSDHEVKVDVKFCQLVNFMIKGEPFKMSKRAGTYITVQDVLEAVGKDILRFMMLTRKNDMGLDFDLEAVKEQSKDNPVFYVQYAHARAHSVLRIAKEELNKASFDYATASLALLASTDEMALLRLLASWPRLVEQAALHAEPHRIAFYLHDLAAAFHGFWNKGKEDPSLRFIHKDNEALTLARLALVKAVATVIASGLQIFNVVPIEQM